MRLITREYHLQVVETEDLSADKEALIGLYDLNGGWGPSEEDPYLEMWGEVIEASGDDDAWRQAERMVHESIEGRDWKPGNHAQILSVYRLSQGGIPGIPIGERSIVATVSTSVDHN
jgi:hypothetical protein